jgi:hypothetical protein
LKFNLGKYCFEAKEITFWGHVVDHQGSILNPTKEQVIFGFPRPILVTNVKAFLGFMDTIRVSYMNMPPSFELIKKDTTLEL